LVQIKFEYRYRNTILHNAHPLTKVAIGVLFSSLSFIWMDFRFTSVLVIGMLILAYIAKLPKSWLLPPIVAFIGGTFTTPTFLFQGNPDLFKVLPRDYVMLGFTIPLGPLTIALTMGVLWWLANAMMKWVVIGWFFFVFYYTTSASDLVILLSKAGVPTRFLFMVMAGFRFFPVFTSLASDIYNAQSLRGWSMKTRNPITFIRNFAPFIWPMFRTFLMAVDYVTLSLSNRPILSPRLESYKKLKLTIPEIVFMIVSLLIVVPYFTYIALTPPYIGQI